MEKNMFIEMFGKVVSDYGFKRAHGGWYKMSKEVINVLDLQKSSFGNSYYLNIKFYIQGIFGCDYKMTKSLVKTEIGNISVRPSEKYNALFDLDQKLSEVAREDGLREMFSRDLVTIIENADSKAGIKTLYAENKLYITPAVKEELGIGC